MSELNDLYSAFDKIGEQFQCERIRTHGGTYMAVAGVPDVLSDPAQAIAGAAIRFLRYLTQRNRSHPIQWQAEIGLATGSVVGSVVGHQRYIYDVFGPAVEAAINLRRRAGTMRISADRATVEEIADAFSTEPIAGPDGAGEAFAITDWAASTTGEPSPG